MCAIIAIAMSFAGVQSSPAAVPLDAGSSYWHVSPLRLHDGDTIRIVSILPYPSELSPSEEFARRLQVRIKRKVVAESEPSPALRPAIDHRETFGVTWDTTTPRRTMPRVEDSVKRIQTDLEVLLPMMSNGRKFFRNDLPVGGYDVMFGFPPSAAEITAVRTLRELQLLRGEFVARFANASISALRTDAAGADLTGAAIELVPPPDEAWNPEACLARVPVLGPDVVRGTFLSDADAIELPTSADAEATMAELERFPIWIDDDSRFWRERRRLTWTEIGRPLKLPAFVGLFPRTADAAESSSALYRTTSGHEFIEAWETLRASDGIVMSLRSPLADFWDYFERERFLSTLSVHFYQGLYAPSRYVAYYLIPPPEDISERIRDALFSIKLRRPDQPGEAVRETPIALLTIRRKPRVPIWVSPVVRQNLDDATIEEMKKPFEIWNRTVGEVYGSTGTYR